MAKRLWVTVLCAVMALALLPAAARAAGATVKIGGVGLPAGQSVSGDTGYARLSADGTTLELNNFQLTNFPGDTGIEIINSGDFTLELIGASEISGASHYGLYASNGYNLTVKSSGGGGSLKATSGWYGIALGGGMLTVESGTLHGVSTGLLGVNSSGIIINSRVGPAPFGITVTGGKLIGEMIPGPSAPIGGNGIEVRLGAMTVSGSGTVTGTGASVNGEAAHGVSAKTLTVRDHGVITGAGTGLGSTGICAEETITVSDGKLTGSAVAGVQANKLTMSGGTALFTASHIAVLMYNPQGLPDFDACKDSHTITASKDTSGSPPETYDENNLGAYKYLLIAPVKPVPSEGSDASDGGDGGITLPLAVDAKAMDVYAAPGETARMQVAATGSAGPFRFQWFKRTGPQAAWQKIGGATEMFYDTGVLGLASDGLQYSCLVTDNMIPAARVRSAIITLHVGGENGAGRGALPATGDGQTPLLWLGVCALCAAGLVALGQHRIIQRCDGERIFCQMRPQKAKATWKVVEIFAGSRWRKSSRQRAAELCGVAPGFGKRRRA